MGDVVLSRGALVRNEEQAISLSRAAERTKEYILDHLAASTKRAYATDFDRFVEYCGTVGFAPMPADPQCLAMHLAAMADMGYSLGSIRRAVSGIAKAHEMAGHRSPHGDPAVKYAMRGIARRLGERPVQVDALKPADLKKLIDVTLEEGSNHLRDTRNAAMMAFGFAGAFRRSELVALRLSDVKLESAGYRVLIRRSKTDQTAKGREVGIPYADAPAYCPVRLTERWMEAVLDAADAYGVGDPYLWCPLSRDGKEVEPWKGLSDRTVARTVQKAVEDAGVEGWYAGHSLRAGLVTAAAKAGKAPHVIQGQTGHKSVDMIMRYIRREGLFDDNAAEGVL